MSDETQEELNIIEERAQSKEPSLKFTLSINELLKKTFYQDPIIVFPDTTIAEIINHFINKDAECVLVAEKDTNKLIGIFTERDVIKKLINKGHDHTKEMVSKYMTKIPDPLLLNDPIAYALNRMATGGYRPIPLVDKNHCPVGVLSVSNIVKHLIDYYPNEILNLPSSPHTKQHSREGG